MISERLKSIILRELGLDDFAITATTLAHEVPGWDSLNHLQILSAVEKDLGIRFGSLDVIRLKNIGDLQALVDRKLNGR